MKELFSAVVTVFVVVSFLLLAGCPKKITPVKKSVRAIRPVKPVKPISPPVEEDTGNATSIPLVEEEIPRIARLEESEEILPKNTEVKDQKEKTSALKDLFFDFDQSGLRPIDLSVIEKNSNWIMTHPGQKVIIEGHGDSRGTNEYNLVLGEKRANTVKNAMVALGIDASKIQTISYGEERPFCTKENETCYQENRRAHFYVE